MLREAAAYASRPPTSRLSLLQCTIPVRAFLPGSGARPTAGAGPALSMLAVSYCFDLQSTLVIEDT
jgi:hypothetical protein